MLKLCSRVLSTVAACSFLVGTAVVAAAPAQAAPVQCTFTRTDRVAGLFVHVPYHPTLASGCQQWLTSPTQKADRIVWLQRSLNLCHRAGLTVDGSYGPRTRDAVRTVQARYGLTVDGYYGSRTGHAMQHARYSDVRDSRTFVSCGRHPA